MTAQEIKNKINSISYSQNQHIKSGALNVCEAMIKSKLLTKYGKSEVEKIKAEIEKIKDPWIWNDKPDFTDLRDIQNKLNELYSILE